MNLDTVVDILKAKPAEQLCQELSFLAKSITLSLPPMLENAQPASVLIPIITHEKNPSILLIERTDNLSHHANQISFPGGKRDETDQDAKACALREMQEEIGIAPEQVEIIAALGEWPSRSGFRITPFVGLLHPPVKIKHCQEEVKASFEIPLNTALDLRNYQKVQLRQRQYYEILYQDKRIWGFTAGVLYLLALYIEKNTPFIHS